MGGLGSSRWGCYTRKYNTDEVWGLPMKQLNSIIADHAMYRSIEWKSTRTRAITLTAQAKAVIRNDRLFIQLGHSFTTKNPAGIHQTIEIITQPRPKNGYQRYFLCPNLNCKCRCTTLYITPQQQYFTCRKCADLSYESCQEQHNFRALSARLGINPHLLRKVLG